MFLQQNQPKRLWKKIGLDGPSGQLTNSQIQFVESEKSSAKPSPMSSLQQSLIKQKRKIELMPLDSLKSQGRTTPLGEKAQKFQNLMQKLQLEVQQIEESQHIIVDNQHSRIEEINVFDRERSEKCQLDSFYNYDISRSPESVTPLVYSKNCKKAEEIKFRKENVRLELLRFNISELKKALKSLKQQLQAVFSESKRLQENLREQVCWKYQELQREYSLKVQQSIFNHKQEYQQLKYHYQILKTKGVSTKNHNLQPSTLPEAEASTFCHNCYAGQRRVSELIGQNQSLKRTLALLQAEKEKLSKQAAAFKNKIAEIQDFTSQIKVSNDKLYEYVFDLEQQLAFYKQEVPNIKKSITQEMADYYAKQISQNSAERTAIQKQYKALQSQLKMQEEEREKLKADLIQYEKELEKLKLVADKYKKEQAQLLKLNEERVSELLTQLRQKEQELKNTKKLIEEKDIMLAEYFQTINRSKLSGKGTNSWQYQQQRVNTRDKFKQCRTETQINEHKEYNQAKLLQALQVDKMVLQKQNMQLKATIQLYNKMSTLQPNYHSNRQPQPLTSYYIPREPISAQPNIPQSHLYLKQRELLKYQGFLQSEAQRLQAKQKEMEIETTLRKNLQQKYKENYNMPERIYEMTAKQDDYGMKAAATHAHRNNYHTADRKNNFCSTEAQAIIEKVKMRQVRKPLDSNNQCRCPDLRNCRCEVLSRGSRGSRDSNSRDYIKMQHYRPPNYSPASHADDYLRRDEKSQKMKMIEDKVRRLKSQLKNSLSTMKD